MTGKFTVDDVAVGALLEELTAVTAYAQDLLFQVATRASGEAVTWNGAASSAFTAQVDKWHVEGSAMVAELQHLADWVANAREQYKNAGETALQGWV